MADVNSVLLSRHRAPADQSSGRSPASAPDPHLITFVELLFFAYRDFTSEADAVLAEFGLGRAHHRVLHFVNRNPGLRVADLLEILKITKQSLARAGAGSADAAARFLFHMVTKEERALVEALLPETVAATAVGRP